MIWTYMGPRAEPPPLPHFEWMDVPEEQRQMSSFLRGCNWMQALEGDIDTTHSGFLHGVLERTSDAVNTWRREHPPGLDVVSTRYGVMYGGRYGDIEAGQSGGDATTTYWRVSNFLFPFYTFFPSRPNGLVPGHIWVPLGQPQHDGVGAGVEPRAAARAERDVARAPAARWSASSSSRPPTAWGGGVPRPNGTTTTTRTAICSGRRPSPASPPSRCRTRR